MSLHPFLTIMCGVKRKSLLPYPTQLWFFVQKVGFSRCTAHPFHTGIKRQSCAERFTDCNLPKSDRHVALLSLSSRISRPRTAFNPQNYVAKSASQADVSCGGARFGSVFVTEIKKKRKEKKARLSLTLPGAATSPSLRVIPPFFLSGGG